MKSKIISTLSMVGASLAMGPVFIVGWVLGLLVGNFGGGKASGKPGRVKSIVIPFWKWKIHLHHWLCSLGLIGISSAYGIYLLNPYVTYGLLGGLAFQGIYNYDDWHRVIISRRTVNRRQRKY